MQVLICIDFHRMSNREQPIEILLELRKKVVYAVVHHKMKKSTVAKLFGFCATSVGKYVREYELYGEDSFQYKKRGVKESERCFLSPEQINLLISVLLSKTPDVVKKRL